MIVIDDFVVLDNLLPAMCVEGPELTALHVWLVWLPAMCVKGPAISSTDKEESDDDDDDDDDKQPYFTLCATTLNEPPNDSGTYPVSATEYTTL